MLKQIGYLYPEKIREKTKKIFGYVGIYDTIEEKVGAFLLISLFVSICAGILAYFVYNWTIAILISIGAFFAIHFLSHTILTLIADKKASVIESVLPDALHLFAMSLKSGLPVDTAFFSISRRELGIFQKEIDIVGKEIALGTPIEDALLNMTKRVKSKDLEDIMKLISSSIKSGGKLANLVETSAINLKYRSITKERIKSSIEVYKIYIFFATSFGAPVLYAIVIGLVTSMVENMKKFAGQIPPSFPITITSGAVEPEFIIAFSIVMLVITTIASCLTIGKIVDGKVKYGLKYIPVQVTIALLVFFLLKGMIMTKVMAMAAGG